jgi:hypothetical protein
MTKFHAFSARLSGNVQEGSSMFKVPRTQENWIKLSLVALVSINVTILIPNTAGRYLRWDRVLRSQSRISRKPPGSDKTKRYPGSEKKRAKRRFIACDKSEMGVYVIRGSGFSCVTEPRSRNCFLHFLAVSSRAENANSTKIIRPGK